MERKKYFIGRISALTSYCQLNNIVLPYVNKRFTKLQDYKDYYWELKNLVDNFHDSLSKAA